MGAPKSPIGGRPSADALNMADPSFDPSGAVRFDLRSGSASDSRGARLVLVPSTALDGLGDDVLEQLGSQIGKACGARVAARLGGDSGVRSAALEVAVSHIAGELAIAGIGAVHVERWGRALVAVVANASISNDAFLGAVVSSALAAASGRDVSAAALGRQGGVARFFLGSAATSERVRDLAKQGKPYAEIVATVQGAST